MLEQLVAGIVVDKWEWEEEQRVVSYLVTKTVLNSCMHYYSPLVVVASPWKASRLDKVWYPILEPT